MAGKAPIGRRTRKTTVAKIDTAQRVTEALGYRKMGYTFQSIGEFMGVTGARAFQLVEMGLSALPREAAETVRSLELERLDMMSLKAIEAACEGDPRAIDAVLKIMDRRAKLLGLDAPTRQEHSGPNGQPIETRDMSAREELARRIAILSTRLGESAGSDGTEGGAG